MNGTASTRRDEAGYAAMRRPVRSPSFRHRIWHAWSRRDGHARVHALHLLQRTNGEDWETLVIHGPASIPSNWMKPPPPPESVMRKRRKSGIHIAGSIASGLALAGGGAALAVGLDARAKYLDPNEPYEDKPEQLATNNSMMPLGIGLLSAGAIGLGVVWAVPW